MDTTEREQERISLLLAQTKYDQEHYRRELAEQGYSLTWYAPDDPDGYVTAQVDQGDRLAIYQGPAECLCWFVAGLREGAGHPHYARGNH